MKENPFEKYELDPRSGPQAITARFRELMTDARTEEEKAQLRAAWEALTLHPRDRLRAALQTWPEAREEIPLGVDSEPPPLPQLGLDDLELGDLLAAPLVASAFTPDGTGADDDVTLFDDPLLEPVLGRHRPGGGVDSGQKKR
jgi:hypothetical protein